MNAFFKYLAGLCLLMFVSIGCEPQSTVNDPNVPDDVETDVDLHGDADDDTNVIVPPTTTQPTTPPAQTNEADGTSVDVGVGGGQGVNVDVNPNGASTTPDTTGTNSGATQPPAPQN